MIFFASSCKKEIEFDEIGGILADSAIKTENDLVALYNSGYFALAQDDDYGGSNQIFNELLGDHIAGTTLDGDYLGIFGRNVNIFNAAVSNAYGQMNKPIYQANLVLDYIHLASDANKNAIAGQAKFLRGFAMFDLVRLYANPYQASNAATEPGIPLRLNSQRQKLARSTVSDTYAQIISDLKSADTLLSATNAIYASKWAAKAILARVYFQMNDYTNAYLYSNEVINNGGFTFSDSLTHRYSSIANTEAIFSLFPEANNPQGRFQRLRNNYNTQNSVLPYLRLTETFYNKATASSDNRKVWYSKKNGFFLLGKFDTPSIKLPVIHLTELKLIRAEAAAETNTHLTGAIGDMNDIIKRAYGATSPLLLPTNANGATIKIAARRERELELVGEGNWVQELKRRGAKGETISIRGSSWNCPGEIFPFPINEVNYSAPLFIQNPTGGCN